jgi:hypothetical protein
MNIRPGIVIVTAVGALMMGCGKRDKPDIQQGSAATGSPSCTLPETSIGPQQQVTAGTYCVCDAMAHDEHGDFVGIHLPKDDKVVINTLADETAVQLGATTLKMKRSAGDKELEALVEYPHDKNNNPTKVVHKVRVKPIENQPTNCDKINKNVLIVTFCLKEGSGWNCGDALGGHQGDTHVQN